MYTQSQLLPDDLHPGHRNYQHNRNIHGCHQPEWRKVGPQSTANLEEIPEVNVEEYIVDMFSNPLDFGQDDLEDAVDILEKENPTEERDSVKRSRNPYQSEAS